MIMTPLMHRSAYAVSPSAMDAALQRFLQATTAQDTVQQDGQVFSISVDVPGLSRDQLRIELQDKTVRLTSVEGAPRSIQRAWKLPASIDAAASKASLENGVLTLVLSTTQPSTQTLAIA